MVNLLRKTFVHKIIAYFCGYDFIFYSFVNMILPFCFHCL